MIEFDLYEDLIWSLKVELEVWKVEFDVQNVETDLCKI